MSIEHLSGHTYHRRLGSENNAFRYSVDYVLVDLEQEQKLPWLFSRNRANLMSLYDRDHGGELNNGTGASWVREVFSDQGTPLDPEWSITLLAQPRIAFTKFTPVSFWLVRDHDGQLRAVIAEVNNTFGERHSYICAQEDFYPLGPNQVVRASKTFHVSPFQPVEGDYAFSFDITDNDVSVRIEYKHGNGGLLATLKTQRQKLSNRSIFEAVIRRPFGSLRVLTLIHWQALRLWKMGAGYHAKPSPPTHAISK